MKKSKEEAQAYKKQWNLNNPEKLAKTRKKAKKEFKRKLLEIKDFAPEYYNKMVQKKVEEKKRYRQLESTKNRMKIKNKLYRIANKEKLNIKERAKYAAKKAALLNP